MTIPGNFFGFWAFLALSTVLFGTAFYTFLVWREVGGVRGFALTVCALAGAVITSTFAISYSGAIHFVDERVVLLVVGGTRIPIQWIIAVQQAAWIPLVVFLALMADLWVSDRNSHRSVTFITYTWYARLRDGKRRAAHREGDA